jgi:CheY-like chemotaxis protein
MVGNNKALYRVLVVNTDARVCELWFELLCSPARSIEVRDTPQAALEFLEQQPVDVVLVDSALPAANATRFIEKIRQRSPTTHVLFCAGLLANDACAEAQVTKANHPWHGGAELGALLQLVEADPAG